MLIDQDRVSIGSTATKLPGPVVLSSASCCNGTSLCLQLPLQLADVGERARLLL
jgi:hypothetical protein